MSCWQITSNSSDALVVIKGPDINAAMSNDKLDELYQKLKSSTAAAPKLRHHLISQLHIAAGIVERLRSTSTCGLAHLAAATLTQRQDGLNNSLVRLVSFVENPLGKRRKSAPAASSKADAIDAPAPFAKPQPKSNKRTLTLHTRLQTRRTSLQLAIHSQSDSQLQPQQQRQQQNWCLQSIREGLRDAWSVRLASSELLASREVKGTRLGSLQRKALPLQLSV